MSAKGSRRSVVAEAVAPIVVYRIGADTATYAADDRSGAGAEQHPGRWNVQGAAVLYTSTSRALACLETLAHVAPAGAFPFNRYLVEYAIPASAWASRVRIDHAAAELVGWDAIPAGKVSKSWGNDWLASGRSLIAEVPSVLVPEESNVLINPAHPDARDITARKVRKWLYDPRFWRSA